MNHKLKHLKCIAGLLLFCMIFVMMFFTIFTAAHFLHECTGAKCLTCHELHVAEALTKQFAAAIMTVVAAFFTALLSNRIMIADSISPFPGRTLVMDKVRMDN
ncbi:MAG: hypothetical protein AAGU76_09750 [Sedimentibacter sp.]|uniref:hypothetical protein n=1 Tax=Sedimentibacter sp. TaxID=1960295 RepID=UPI003158DBFF